MTETKSRFGWLAGVALTAGTVFVGGWSPEPVSSTVTTTAVTPAPVALAPAVKVTRTTTTTTEQAAPVHQPARHAVRTAHRHVVRHDDVVSDETTETTVVPAAPVSVTRTIETTTTR